MDIVLLSLSDECTSVCRVSGGIRFGLRIFVTHISYTVMWYVQLQAIVVDL